MRTASILSLIIAAVPVLGQAQEAEGEALKVLIDKNSENCDFTFFSEGDDVIDLRGQRGAPCFDLKGGRDILALDPENFPDGVRVFTGPGRDVVVLPDGDDKVVSFDDEDEEFILRGGDDRVEIQGLLAGGLGRPGEAQRTKIRPGSGDDVIRFGRGEFEGAVRYRSPDVEIWNDTEGRVQLEAYCGRFFDERTVDFTIPVSVPDSEMAISARGCGVSLVRQSGPLTMSQDGGRLNLAVRSGEYAFENTPARIDAEIENGSALSASFETSSRETSFHWAGFGLAAFNGRFTDDRMGGDFSISSEKSVYGTVALGLGNMSLRAAGGREIEMVMEGALDENLMEFSFSAPKIVLSWFPSFGRFPSIDTRQEDVVKMLSGRREASRTTVVQAIEHQEEREAAMEKARSDFENAAVITKEGRKNGASAPAEEERKKYGQLGEAAQAEIFYSAVSTYPMVEEMSVSVEKVDLKFHRDSDGQGCIDLMVRDAQQVLPDLDLNCSEAPQVVDVSAFETLVLSRGVERMSIEINGSTDFRLDTLVLRN